MADPRHRDLVRFKTAVLRAYFGEAHLPIADVNRYVVDPQKQSPKPT